MKKINPFMESSDEENSFKYFDFNCTFIYAKKAFFSSADVRKNLKSTYLSIKKLHAEDQSLCVIV